MLFSVLMLMFSVGVLIHASRHDCCGIYSRGLMNPFFFLAILLLLIALDFYILYGDAFIDIYESLFYVDKSNVRGSFLFFSASAVCISLGVLAAIFFNVERMFYNFDRVLLEINKIKYKNLSYIFGFVSLLFVLVNLTDLLNAQVSRQVLFRENIIFSVMYAMLPISFSIYLSGKLFFDREALILGIFCVVAIFFSGSRGGVIFFAIILASWAAKKVKISQIFILPIFVAIPWLLSLIRYYFRETWRYDSFWDFIGDNGGIFNLFFGTAEVSLAEAITTVFIFYDRIERNVFDSILAFFMYPLPRSIFSFKPISSDALVTGFLSPIRWETAKSEIVISGFSDFLLSFGYFGALVTIFIFSAMWSGACIFAMKSRFSVVFVPILTWWIYIFVRSGIYNMAASFWAFFGLIIFGFIFMRSNHGS